MPPAARGFRIGGDGWEDGLDEIVRHVGGQIRLVIDERRASEIDRRAVIREIGVAVRTAAQVPLELRGTSDDSSPDRYSPMNSANSRHVTDWPPRSRS